MEEVINPSNEVMENFPWPRVEIILASESIVNF